MTKEKADFILKEGNYYNDDLYKVCFINEKMSIIYTSYHFMENDEYMVFKMHDFDTFIIGLEDIRILNTVSREVLA